MISDSDIFLALAMVGSIYLAYAVVFIFILLLIIRKKTTFRIGLAALFILLSISPHYYFQVQTHMRAKALKRAAIIPDTIDFKGKSILAVNCRASCGVLKQFSGAAHVYATSTSRFDALFDATTVDLLPLVEHEVMLEKSEYYDGEYEIIHKADVSTNQIDFVVFYNKWGRKALPEFFTHISNHTTEYGFDIKVIAELLVVFSVEDPRKFSADQIKLALFSNTGGRSAPMPYLLLGKTRFRTPEYDFFRSNLQPLFCPNASQEQCRHPF